jgi:hypothetical protein
MFDQIPVHDLFVKIFSDHNDCFLAAVSPCKFDLVAHGVDLDPFSVVHAHESLDPVNGSARRVRKQVLYRIPDLLLIHVQVKVK